MRYVNRPFLVYVAGVVATCVAPECHVGVTHVAVECCGAIGKAGDSIAQCSTAQEHSDQDKRPTSVFIINLTSKEVRLLCFDFCLARGSFRKKITGIIASQLLAIILYFRIVLM